MVTAIGEVHTNEEAQVYVHDLELFVTVQILDDAPAGRSLGQLCEDHGYSYEWVSGQKPRLTKQGKYNSCKAENFVPLVVPGLSSNSGTSSSSTSPFQDSSSTSSSPASERSDEHRTRKLARFTKNSKIRRRTSIEPRTTVCEISQIVYRSSQIISKIQKCPHPHTFLMTQIWNVLQKCASRKHSVQTHFTKDRYCEVSLRTKMTRAPCRRRIGEALLRAEKFGDLMTADHKVLDEEGEYRNDHRYAVVVQDLATQCIQFYPCKTKTSQETEKSLKPKILIKYVATKNRLADMPTKESFTRDEWNHLLLLSNIISFSMFSCSHISNFF